MDAKCVFCRIFRAKRFKACIERQKRIDWAYKKGLEEANRILEEHHEAERAYALKELGCNASFKVAAGMARGYKSTRMLLDLVKLEGNINGIEEAIFEQCPYCYKVTFKHVGDKTYAVMHLNRDESGYYKPRS